MAIDPEVISSSSSKGKTTEKKHLKWVIYGAGGIGIFLLLGLVKSLIALLGMGLLLAFVWSQVSKPS